jgi:hypothetical protein
MSVAEAGWLREYRRRPSVLLDHLIGPAYF